MLEFRFYLIDLNGRIASREDGLYANDDQAVAGFSMRRPGKKAELWHGERLVASLDGATTAQAAWR